MSKENGNGNIFKSRDEILQETLMSEEDLAKVEQERKEMAEIESQWKEEQKLKKAGQGRKKIIPYGDRVIVKRRAIGEKLGNSGLILDSSVAERLTELADVIAVPELTFCDKEIIENSEAIITNLSKEAQSGDPSAINALMAFNTYLKLKTLQVGDVVMVGKYTGIDFSVGETGEQLSVTDYDGIRALIVESK